MWQPALLLAKKTQDNGKNIAFNNRYLCSLPRLIFVIINYFFFFFEGWPLAYAAVMSFFVVGFPTVRSYAPQWAWALQHGTRAGGLLLVGLASALARVFQRGGLAASYRDGFQFVLTMWKQSRDQKPWVFIALLAATSTSSLPAQNLMRG